jgi:hypothetical protein
MADRDSQVTIQHLDVQFDVHGDDKEVFAKLFDERFAASIRRWCREEQEHKARKRMSQKERSLGDRSQAPEEA